METKKNNFDIKHIKARLAERVLEKIKELKKQLASKFVVKEAEEVGDFENKGPDATDVQKGVIVPEQPTKITKIKLGGNQYRYVFPFKSRIYIVDFKPIDENATKYGAQFHAKGFEKSGKPMVRFGISSPQMIPELFEHILNCVKQFISVKKPQSVRFVPGSGVSFPVQMHQYIYQALQGFEHDIKKLYSVTRGDVIKDGSAFVLRKGGSQSNLKSKAWRPSAEVKKPEEK